MSAQLGGHGRLGGDPRAIETKDGPSDGDSDAGR